MYQNNVLNAILASEKSNFQYDSGTILRNHKRPIITFNNNIEHTESEPNNFTGYEEKEDLDIMDICPYYPKARMLADAIQHAKTSASENKMELSMKTIPCLKKENVHVEKGHDWSQLSTSRICKILEDIADKKNKTRRQSAPLQKTKYFPTNENQNTDIENQNWSQIPNEDICALIEKIASRRNKNRKRKNLSCSKVQEIQGNIDLPKKDVQEGDISDSSLLAAVRGTKKVSGYDYNSEDKIPNAIRLPYCKQILRLFSFLQMKRNDLIVTSENCNSGVFFSNFNYQLQVKSNCIANIASTLSFLPHHEITVYTSFILYPNVVDNIWECTRYAIQLLKSEAAQFTLLRDIYSGFTIILSNHRYHPKGFSADYCYSANELTLFLFVIRTGQKKVLYRSIPHNTAAIEKDSSFDTENRKRRSEEEVVLKCRKCSNNSLALKEISTYRLDSAEGFEKSQPLKDEAKLIDMNYVQGSISYNRTILTGLWKLFHRLCCKDRYRKTNLSETLFYDDSTERWVRMGELMHY